MFYELTRPFAKIAIGIYFRKIYLSNKEAIPKDKPVILATNHPTAFIDPCVMACYQGRPLHFLARGDLYVNNFFIRKLYDVYRMIPVFRRDDAGYSGVKTNFESFDRTFDALKENKTVMILAEGRTKHEKRLRPLMKGTARIVFGAREKYGDLDIYIVPVGINYTNSDKFRSEVMVDIGEPIRIRDFAPVYEENQAKAINLLTQEMAKRMGDSIIHIEDPKDDVWVEKLLEMKHNERESGFWPVAVADRKPFLEEKKITDTINAMSDSKKLRLKSQLENYLTALKKTGVTDKGLVDHSSYNLPGAILLGIGWLPYMAGYLLNALPVMLGDRIATRLASSIEFRASMSGVFASFLWLFWWMIWILAAAISGQTWLWVIVVLIPVLGYFYVFYKDINDRWQTCKDVALLEDEQIETLLELRQNVWKEL